MECGYCWKSKEKMSGFEAPNGERIPICKDCCQKIFGWTFKQLAEHNKKIDQGAVRSFRLGYRWRRKFSGGLLREFFQFAKAWKLNTKEKMCLLGVKTYQEYGKRKKGAVVLSSVEVEQLGWIFSIAENLYILLKEKGKDWMKKPNDAPLFGGQSAMEYIMASDFPMHRILAVRNYLASQLL